jgi:hypothetical protein
MLHRVAFIFLAGFWVTMNVLLWRAEYGRHPGEGNAVPPVMVWKKILSAPDNSSLVILCHGKNAGFCRWAPEIVGTGGARSPGPAGDLPEDMVSHITGYRLSLDGNVALPEPLVHVRFSLEALLGRDRAWREAGGKFLLHRGTCEIRSVAAAQTVQLKLTGVDGGFEREFTFAELQHPQALLQEFAGPLPFSLPEGLALPPQLPAAAPVPALGLVWEAHDAWIKLGHTATRAYRLEAHLLDRYQIVLIVSHVGEILRAELPGDYVLVNDRLSGI